MTERPEPTPQDPPIVGDNPGRLKMLATGVGCLLWLAVAAVVAVFAVAVVVSEPAFWIAFAAICVAISALAAAKRRK